MRPSSGGSSRISKRLRPACARAAISTARPSTGTAGAAALAVVAAAAVGAEAAVRWRSNGCGRLPSSKVSTASRLLGAASADLVSACVGDNARSGACDTGSRACVAPARAGSEESFA
jgi:hypothetical protein